MNEIGIKSTTIARGAMGQMNRRDLLRAGGAGLVAVSVAACSEADPIDGADEPVRADELEAPGLAQRVEDGDLPPLEERLPPNPLVVEPVDRVGVYGGEWRTVLLGGGTTLYRHVGYEQLMRWNHEFTDLLPNLAESVEVADEGREYIIHLRPGVKWSDGEAFTADDIMFAYDDVVANQELLPSVSSWLTSAGEPAVFEKVDDVTVRVSFAAPNGLFRQNLATPAGEQLTTLPRHHLEQFHADYNPDVDSLVEAEGFASWAELFTAKADRFDWGRHYQDIEHPTLNAWQLVDPLGEGTQVVFERNPYYWKTDPDGRQLPYLDRVGFDVLEDAEVALLKATNGELDLVVRDINTSTNKPVLAGSREEGDYRFFDMVSTLSALMGISLNLTHQDPVKREIFNNKDFRIGLSHAINREEIIEAVFQGEGEPLQAAPLPESPFYDEDMSTQYTEYNVDLANQHLDQAGYSDRDGDGFRLGPDGNRISFDVQAFPELLSGALVDGIDLVRQYWRDVDIDMRVQSISQELWFERLDANEHDATTRNGAGGGLDVLFQPRWFLPDAHQPGYGVAWANWYTNGPEPREEPPSAVKQQMGLYDQLVQTADDDEKFDLMRQILEIAKDEFYTIGIVAPTRLYGIVKNNFHNVVEPMIDGFQFVSPGPSNPEQYFIE